MSYPQTPPCGSTDLTYTWSWEGIVDPITQDADNAAMIKVHTNARTKDGDYTVTATATITHVDGSQWIVPYSF